MYYDNMLLIVYHVWFV